MKKLVVLMLVLFLCFGCSAKEKEPGQVLEVPAVDIQEMFDQKEDFVFFVAQTTCPHCEVFFETLDEYLPNNSVTIYYVEADDPINHDTFDYIWDTYFPDVSNTPTTLLVRDGEIIDSEVGDLTAEELDDFFDRNDWEH